jgi:tyrosyl-tRNA synthetase
MINNNLLLERGVDTILPSKYKLAQFIKSHKVKVYLGLDPTANLLHLGHSIPLRKLNQFAQMGAETILLVGNGTVKIGDPTGKDKNRPQLSDSEINQNFLTWKRQADKVLDFSKVKIVYNDDWLSKLKFSDFIKLLSNSTIQQLLERDMFAKRQERSLPIFAHEIIYPLIQGYDSVALDVNLEIGGTDQTFNMMMGRHLQKIYNNKEKFILTVPLIDGLDGQKMSKSLNNFISLEEKPNSMYGQLMSIRDEQIINYFELLTNLPNLEIEEIKIALKNGENPINFKKKLAFTITSDLHNEVEAHQAQKNFEKVVQNREIPEDIPEILIKPNTNLKDILHTCQINFSSSDIKRMIKQNGIVIVDKSQKINHINNIINQNCLLKVGKRKFFKLKIEK